MYVLMSVLVWMNVLGVDMALMNVIGSVHGMDGMYLGRVHVAMLFLVNLVISQSEDHP